MESCRILNLIENDSAKPRRSAREGGFTLVELLTVAIIIGILAGMSFALLSRIRSQAIETNAQDAMNAIATGYEMYYFHNYSYPQWGADMSYSSPWELFKGLVEEQYLPDGWKRCKYDPATGYIYGLTQDYAVEIPRFNPNDPTISAKNSYFVIFHPYNFQRDELAIGLNPPTGWVAVRVRKGPADGNYRTFRLFVPKRMSEQ